MNTDNINIEPNTNLGWRKELTKKHWQTLMAAFLGWALDIMDLFLYAAVIVYIMKDFGMNTGYGGVLASAALLASACGGLVFGVIADKYGRIHAMTFSILIYAAATFLCGLSQTVMQLLFCRILVGLGMGGEYASGASLVTETWPAKYRVRAMAFVQCGFTVGTWFAMGLAMAVIPHFGWRAVFFAGALPALLVFWIRRCTPESAMWEKKKKEMEAEHKTYSAFAIIKQIFFGKERRKTIMCLLYCCCIMLGYWGLATWMPAYLSMPVEQGGRGLSLVKSGWIVILFYFASMCGYFVFGVLSDKVGLKRICMIWIVGLVVSVPIYLSATSINMLIIANVVAGFFNSVYAGFGPIMSELFPTELRATATGTVYNIARAVSGITPILVGGVAISMGIGKALFAVCIFYAISLIFIALLPVKGNQNLEEIS